ncbi:MAG: hypothetical protein GC155_06680 [Alphaproteobacteria bacterium]|nr:hypothetical protein [Alphaproteobacteria bacterium]
MIRATPVIFGVFAALATAILLLAGLSLLSPGGPLEAIWMLTPKKFETLKPWRAPVGGGFLVLAIPAAMASFGSFRRRRWAWWILVVGIAVNGLGDLAQMAFGRITEGLVGGGVAALVLVWLTRPAVKAVFER